MSGHRRGETPPGAPPPPAEYEFVDDASGIESVASTLESSAGPVAVDVERASGIRYSERAFLLQLRPTDGPALLVDPETPGQTVGPLADILSRRPLLLHAASQDLPSLRDLGIRPTSLVDTELAGRFLGIERVNLGAMISEHLGIGLAKAHSAADWSRRPLPPAWLDYAAYDVLFLHELADAVLPRLDELGRREWFEAECRHLVESDPAPAAADPWRRLSRLASLRDTRQIARARELWMARDRVAAERDIAPKRLLTDAAIIEAARTAPTNRADLLAIDGFDGPHRRRLADEWLAALEWAAELGRGDLPARQAPRGEHPPHTTWKRTDPEAAALLDGAREAIGALAEELGIEQGLLLKASTLRLWAWRAATTEPADDAALLHRVLQEEGARGWQVELTETPLLRAVHEFRSQS
ncbi:HRDC domain-containing protein [Dietzia psychralcaliphila]|uniref:3'-5' exonuclease n=2 Tax=Dietzia psychralcaliphila TaxID=139021 RepID=A0AAD0NN97_9ACTN|nr:HRDC domain-containing protein [Dietzia psychralcaliphila]AWH95607.1 3'-5' exonuclease [Dietzia psychralcaliphila]PTM88637.1 ribonuclease D [Dietzia psychralcaliphila]